MSAFVCCSAWLKKKQPIKYEMLVLFREDKKGKTKRESFLSKKSVYNHFHKDTIIFSIGHSVHTANSGLPPFVKVFSIFWKACVIKICIFCFEGILVAFVFLLLGKFVFAWLLLGVNCSPSRYLVLIAVTSCVLHHNFMDSAKVFEDAKR